MKINRQTAVEHLRTGWPVLVGGRLVERVRDLPPAPEEGQPEPAGVYVATRHPSGHFTHDGLKAVIESGGSVLHHGVVIERVDDLPAEEDLAAGDTKRLNAVEDEIDRQMATLAAQRAKVQRERQRAGESSQTGASDAGAPAPATPPPAIGQKPVVKGK
jgi:hypothetical protein